MIEVASKGYSIFVVIPVYRDWEAASVLCDALDRAFAEIPGAVVHILFVDDGSPTTLQGWDPAPRRSLRSVRVMFLRRNVGHQRAITAGLCYVHEMFPCDAVLVMDADGEDRPEDATVLASRAMASPGRIVFAERRKRLEGGVFRAGYVLYRLLHRLLTGVSVRVGNFSVVPFSALSRLVCMSEMWNHYAGAVFKSKLDYETVSLDRGRRYLGQSHMNLVSLVNHGLAGIASFHDVAATRILIASGVAMLTTSAALVAVVWVRVLTDLAIPGWATYTAGLLLVVLIQVVATAFTLVFTLIASRGHLPLIPARDYSLFVDRVEELQ